MAGGSAVYSLGVAQGGTYKPLCVGCDGFFSVDLCDKVEQPTGLSDASLADEAGRVMEVAVSAGVQLHC